METILEIREVPNYSYAHPEAPKYPRDYEGYIIVTSEQEIAILVSNDSSCCEQWGYFSTNDNVVDFVGAELLGLDIVELDYSKHEVILTAKDISLDSGGAVFVDIRTSRGLLQLAVYNAHNGYYGHDCQIISTQASLNTSI